MRGGWSPRRVSDLEKKSEKGGWKEVSNFVVHLFLANLYMRGGWSPRRVSDLEKKSEKGGWKEVSNFVVHLFLANLYMRGGGVVERYEAMFLG